MLGINQPIDLSLLNNRSNVQGQVIFIFILLCNGHEIKQQLMIHHSIDDVMLCYVSVEHVVIIVPSLLWTALNKESAIEVNLIT